MLSSELHNWHSMDEGNPQPSAHQLQLTRAMISINERLKLKLYRMDRIQKLLKGSQQFNVVTHDFHYPEWLRHLPDVVAMYSGMNEN